MQRHLHDIIALTAQAATLASTVITSPCFFDVNFELIIIIIVHYCAIIIPLLCICVHSAWKGHPRNALYCVERNVKLYTLTHSLEPGSPVFQ